MFEDEFSKKCFELVKLIPKGKVSTYKEIAKSLNFKGYRYIGKILNKNNKLIEVPCHRIVKSNGEVGGYINGVEKKIEILRSEGIEINFGAIDLKKYFYEFD